MDKDQVKNTADASQVKAAGRRVKDAQAQFDKDLKDVLSSRAGRNVIWHLMARSKVFGSVVNIGDVHMTYFNAGQQDFGHNIMADIVRVDESALLTMMKDNKKTIVEGGS